MKKLTSLLMTMALCAGLLTACGENTSMGNSMDNSMGSSTENSMGNTAMPNENPAAAPSGELRLGLGVVTSTEGSLAAAGEKPGSAKSRAVICAVAVDPDGIVRKIKFDTIDFNIPFDSKGAFTEDISQPVKSLREMGYDYGLSETSSIKKEWFQQMDSLEKWIMGKNVTDVLGMELDENKIPMTDELKGSIDIGVSDQLSALNKAYTNAL